MPLSKQGCACSFCLMSERTSGSTWLGSLILKNFYIDHSETACPNKCALGAQHGSSLRLSSCWLQCLGAASAARLTV